MSVDVARYRRPGPLTALEQRQFSLVDGLPTDPVGICTAVQALVVQPEDVVAHGLPDGRSEERSIRAVRDLLDVLAALDPAPLHRARPPERRVIGTCRHFAVLSTAFLRFRGIPARARCGFGTYFVPGRSVDHWVTEYWAPDEHRWVRIDSEILGRPVVERPDDLAPGQFLTGGEAWTRYRAGSVDPDTFGVAGTEHAWGVGEIRGNAVRDLAALCGVEMLPWDEWGRMDDSYQGRTGADYDVLMDRVADVCASDDAAALDELYAAEDLTVPAGMVR